MLKYSEILIHSSINENESGLSLFTLSLNDICDVETIFDSCTLFVAIINQMLKFLCTKNKSYSRKNKCIIIWAVSDMAHHKTFTNIFVYSLNNVIKRILATRCYYISGKNNFFGKTITHVVCGFPIETRNKINSEFAIKPR